MKVFDINNFPYEVLQSYDILERPKKARGRRYDRKYLDVVCAFDIEATNIKETKQAIMYIWQFAVDEYFICTGRSWAEYKIFMSRLCEQLDDNVYLCVYVHNLSYEFEYLQGQFEILPGDVFAINSRKILNLRILDHIEYRCSYLQSNMGLDTFTDKMQVKHKKRTGTKYNNIKMYCKFIRPDYKHAIKSKVKTLHKMILKYDYDKQRFYYTPMTENELKYCYNDVLGVVECIKAEMKIDGDTLYTIPYTSTGYVRRDMQEALKHCNYNWLKSLQPGYDTYIMLRKAFRGGNTHANRYYVCDRDNDTEIYDNEYVKTMDMASAYPAVILNKKFPVSEFKAIDRPNLQILETAIRQDNACLIHIRFDNIRLRKSNWGAPYIPKDKCVCIQKAIYDNGRILRADSLETWLTDIDYNIIKSEYIFENAVVYNLQVSKYGYLPETVKDVVRKYYKLKTELKGIKGMEILYTKAKNKLNACYGMFAQNPVIFDLLFDTIMEQVNGEEKPVEIYGRPLKRFQNCIDRLDYSDCVTPEQMYDKMEHERKAYIKQKIEELQTRAGFPYQWGVWVCAHCRQQLEKGIQHVYKYYDPFMCYFVYTDTDSVKYSDPENRVQWVDFNAEIAKESLKNGGVATDKKGKDYIIGIYEPDEHIAVKFRTMGAKRYVYEDENGDLHITIAGVDKEKGAKQLKAKGGIKAFKDGTQFKEVSRTAAYNDCGGENYITPDGIEIEVPPNLYLENSDETIQRGIDYTKITLDSAREFVNKYSTFFEKYYLNVDIYDNI